MYIETEAKYYDELIQTTYNSNLIELLGSELLIENCIYSKNEWSKLKLKNSDLVYFVGCGSIPISAIIYMELGINPLKLKLFDSSKTRMEQAKLLLYKFGMPEIECENAFSLDIDYSKCDLVITAGSLKGKFKTIKYIADNFNTNIFSRLTNSEIEKFKKFKMKRLNVKSTINGDTCRITNK